MSQRCEKNYIQPIVSYYWKKQILENAQSALRSGAATTSKKLICRIEVLEQQPARKDNVIAKKVRGDRLGDRGAHKAKKHLGSPDYLVVGAANISGAREETDPVVATFVEQDNHKRLHSTIECGTPADRRIFGRDKAINAAHDLNLEAACQQRAAWRSAARRPNPNGPLVNRSTRTPREVEPSTRR